MWGRIAGGGALRLGNGSESPGRVRLLGQGGAFGDLVGGRRGGGWGVAAGERLPTGCREGKRCFFLVPAAPGKDGSRRFPVCPCAALTREGRAQMLRVRGFPENLSGLCRGRRAPRSHLRRETRLMVIIFINQKMWRRI